MNLTDKTKEEFSMWYVKNYQRRTLMEFKGMPLSMQIGVLILYFDSVGITIEIQVYTEPTMQGAVFKKFRPEILANKRFYNVGASFGNRERAWTQAIERANELRNEQLNK